MDAIVSRFRLRLAFVAVIAAAFMAGLLAVVAASARADPAPIITATADSANHLVVNWPANGHRNPSVYWNTDPTLKTDPDPGLMIGVPLACIWSPGAPTCTGHQAATTATSMVSTNQLAPSTYYVQVEDYFDGTSPSHWDDKWHYSNVAQVIVSAIPPAPPPDAALPPVNFRVPGGTRLAARRGRRYRLNLCQPAPRRGHTCGPGNNQRNPSGGEGGPYVFNLKTGRGALPRGLGLNSRTGLLSGTLSGRPGIYNFVVCAKDMGGKSSQHQTVCRRVRLRVRP